MMPLFRCVPVLAEEAAEHLTPESNGGAEAQPVHPAEETATAGGGAGVHAEGGVPPEGHPAPPVTSAPEEGVGAAAENGFSKEERGGGAGEVVENGFPGSGGGVGDDAQEPAKVITDEMRAFLEDSETEDGVSEVDGGERGGRTSTGKVENGNAAGHKWAAGAVANGVAVEEISANGTMGNEKATNRKVAEESMTNGIAATDLTADAKRSAGEEQGQPALMIDAVSLLVLLLMRSCAPLCQEPPALGFT